LKILLKAGHFLYTWLSIALLDSTAADVYGVSLPHFIPELSKPLLIINVDFMPHLWPYEDSDLVVSPVEHGSTIHIGILTVVSLWGLLLSFLQMSVIT
jgi:hypothetical protein